MKMMDVPVFVALVLMLLLRVDAINLIEHHKQAFEKSFHDRCDKYPFVQQYVNKVEYTNERYLTFVYQESGLKNGGLGDKIGGLISAVAMALRFNRTLILRSAQNEMHEVFRPYHPTDIHSKTPKYAWNNFTSWSNFDWKFANQDATEYDLYDCINNTGQKNSHCSMKDGDAGTPHILYRSNRCYLCYYDNNKGSAANIQMKALGVDETSNLYEVAGCMMRLAMWPTELLWQEVGKLLSVFEKQVTPEAAATVRRNRRALRTRRMDESAPARTPAVVQVGLHFRCGDKSYIKKGGYDHMCVYNEDDTEENKKGLFPLGNPYSMGVCARRSLHSYLTASMLAGTSSSTSSSTTTKSSSEPTNNNNSGSSTSTSTSTSSGGTSTVKTDDIIDDVWKETPIAVSSNANSNVQSNNKADVTVSVPTESEHDVNVDIDDADTIMSAEKPKKPAKSTKPSKTVRRFLQSLLATDASDTHDLDLHGHSDSIAMGFLASDNEMASMQMNTTLGLPYSIVSPQGCHVEMDVSKQCHMFTVTQWFMLALSDVLVTQEGIPSSFSRYAGIYGLKPDPFRNGKHCGAIETTMELSRKPMSNWFC